MNYRKVEESLPSKNRKIMEQDQEFVEYIVKALVDNPQDVRTERTVDEMGVLITLFINPADMGQVIGRMGQTAKAVRTLLRVVGAKHKARVNLKINEPEGSHRGHHGGQSHHSDSHMSDNHMSEGQAEMSTPTDSGMDDDDDFKL
jgi:predicted RNA-binding protein YlqC (UPF0109 family)